MLFDEMIPFPTETDAISPEVKACRQLQGLVLRQEECVRGYLYT